MAFQEIKQLIKEQITITLDTDNIPKEYFQAELGENYFMTYSELFISNHSTVQDQKSDLEEDSDEGDAPDKESNIEELFQINKEMLEREYNLTTLNLEKIAMVNFKDILSRTNKQINDEDIVLPTESSHCSPRRHARRPRKERGYHPAITGRPQGPPLRPGRIPKENVPAWHLRGRPKTLGQPHAAHAQRLASEHPCLWAVRPPTGV